jgi:hypothetical protein
MLIICYYYLFIGLRLTSIHPEMVIFPNFCVRLKYFNSRNTQCIHGVKIFVFLELGKNISFLNGH